MIFISERVSIAVSTIIIEAIFTETKPFHQIRHNSFHPVLTKRPASSTLPTLLPACIEEDRSFFRNLMVKITADTCRLDRNFNGKLLCFQPASSSQTRAIEMFVRLVEKNIRQDLYLMIHALNLSPLRIDI